MARSFAAAAIVLSISAAPLARAQQRDALYWPTTDQTWQRKRQEKVGLDSARPGSRAWSSGTATSWPSSGRPGRSTPTRA